MAGCAGRPSGERPRPQTASAPPPASGAVWDQSVKIGNPYQVAGAWYYPKDDPDYQEEGIASWYGPGFHGQSTANGEQYDQDGISAAHKTLPMPSYVEVTNLENGRHMVVRVNDRGPFVGDRLIDLSRRTAQLLDVERKGTAHVRVRRVHPSAQEIASLQPHVPRTPVIVSPPAGAVMLASAPVEVVNRGANRPPAVAVEPVTPAEQASDETEVVRAVEIPASSAGVRAPVQSAAVGLATPSRPPGGTARPRAPDAPPIFIQVAAVSDRGRASWLAGYLKQFGTSLIERSEGGLYRVRLGPYPTPEAALVTLEQVRLAGYEEAWVVGAPANVPVG